MTMCVFQNKHNQQAEERAKKRLDEIESRRNNDNVCVSEQA